MGAGTTINLPIHSTEQVDQEHSTHHCSTFFTGLNRSSQQFRLGSIQQQTTKTQWRKRNRLTRNSVENIPGKQKNKKNKKKTASIFFFCLFLQTEEI